MMSFPGISTTYFNENVKFSKKENEKNITRPNIILVVVDDQIISSLDIMPTVKSQLMDKGITFSNSFCTSPVCAPARASILTGQYLHNHGEITNGSKKFVNNRDKKDTLATVLKDGGYKNVLIGKYTHGYKKASDVPPGWDEWYAFTGRPGYYNYKISDNKKLRAFGSKPDDYSTDVLAKKATDFIENHKNSRQPFFLYMAPYAPHGPMTPAHRHLNTLRNLQPVTPLYELDISDKPQWVINNRTRSQNIPGKVLREKMAAANVRKLETLMAVDEMLDNIIKKLTNTGKMGNTFIFYLADNGDDVSRHLYARGKLFPYEEGIRTPIIVRGPGIQEAIKREHLVSTVDLLPTIAQLARIPIPGFVDGRSLVPILTRNPAQLSGWRQACLVELGRVNQWPTLSPPPAYKLLRASRFKYIEYDTGEKEFYDLRLDPCELSNIYKNLGSKQKNVLHHQLDRLYNCSKKNCREAENQEISIHHGK